MIDDEATEVCWRFPAGGKPFRAGDGFKVCADIRLGSLYRFVRIADDFVEIHAADESTRYVSDAYRCERDSLPGSVAFVLLPRLAS